MSKNILSKVLFLKVGKVTTKKLQNHPKGELISAIKKEPIQKSYLTKTGFIDDSQGDLLHHGGENKALFLIGDKTYESINKEFGDIYSYNGIANFGENLVLENLQEDDICVGDILSIGEAIVQITQPRQPCWKLSASTEKQNMTKFIFKSGFTGFYAKVLKEGVIAKNDEVILEKRVNESLKISTLNRLILNPLFNEKITLEALECEDLGPAFKKSLKKRYELGDKDDQFSFYHT